MRVDITAGDAASASSALAEVVATPLDDALTGADDQDAAHAYALALFHSVSLQPRVDGWLTGKFVMQTREDADHNAYLSIVAELGPDVAPVKHRCTRRSASPEEQP
ncbi:MAG: hypothetical protein JO057_01480 [Chloroflexi bacterium]|nr:hypothetical protein [Chloroflexota bacterium]